MEDNGSKWLERWFVFHFFVDMLVGIPLFLYPELVLSSVGLMDVNVVLARIVAAALMGIGAESLLGRKANRESYLGMLRLKIVWSSVAMVGLGLGVVSGEISRLGGGGLIGVFLIFNFLWVYWYLRLLREIER
jgi:hypothetical protein